MNWLITGGSGFIGTNLINYLPETEKITVLDIRPPRSRAVEFIPGDVRDSSICRKACLEKDIVIHLAAQTGVLQSFDDFRFDFEINVLGSLNILEASKGTAKKVVLISSSAAVGDKGFNPFNEEMMCLPVSPYGASKLCMETYGNVFTKMGLPTAILRLSNVYGPYSDNKTSVVAKFLKRIKKDKCVTQTGLGQTLRDFVYVEDVCQAIYKAALSEKTGVYQIGAGFPTSIDFLIVLIKENCTANFKVVNTPEDPKEVRFASPCISKAKLELGYEPKTKLPVGLIKTWEYFNRDSED